MQTISIETKKIVAARKAAGEATKVLAVEFGISTDSVLAAYKKFGTVTEVKDEHSEAVEEYLNKPESEATPLDTEFFARAFGTTKATEAEEVKDVAEVDETENDVQPVVKKAKGTEGKRRYAVVKQAVFAILEKHQKDGTITKANRENIIQEIATAIDRDRKFAAKYFSGYKNSFGGYTK